jgi:2,3-bisphosphoglycerate-independent phosphoglycerate mutase
MDRQLEFLSRISHPNEKKILLVIIDGLGGLPHPDYGNKTELQYAKLPNLDEFVRDRKTVTGLIHPVRRGITPGSGTGHLGLFGYDPFFKDYMVGRGAFEAADLEPGEVAFGDIIARFNFCTIDEEGKIIDRRAGRFTNGKELAELLNKKVKINNGVTIKLVSTKDHRGVFIIKNGNQLSANITDTDPHSDKLPPLLSEPIFVPGIHASVSSIKTAKIVNDYTEQAMNILKGMKPANGIIIRGFSTFPNLPHFNGVYSLTAAAIAAYPLYRGVARLIGMKVLDGAIDIDSKISILKKNFEKFDFFFLHYKEPDERGEDRDFLGKVKALEHFDRLFPAIREMNFDVLAITGDHSTPSLIGTHTHHSVPIAINCPFAIGFDKTEHFDEEECLRGSLGQLEGVQLMPILLANAMKLDKFEGFVQ